MKTAVIGANGFLGRKLAELLKEKMVEVVSVYNRNKENVVNGTEAVSMENFLKGQFEVNNIIFSAGSFKNTIDENIELNCNLLYSLTRQYKNCRFIYISSANVYGYPNETINEDSPFFKPNSYGMSKLNGEFIVSGLPNFAIIRLVYLYGSGLENGSFLPFLVEQAREKGIIPLYGQGEREQDYLHVKDAAELIIKALFIGKNKIYLGASGKSVSNKEIAEIIRNELGANSCKIEYILKQETSLSLNYDSSRTKRELQWSPKISIEEGIKDLIQ